MSHFYTITITNGNTNSAPKDGFVDNKRIEDYGLNLETTPTNLTLALCKAKRRGNVRYAEIIRQLGLVANCYVVPNTIVATGADSQTEASSFAFQIIVERGDGVLVTADESNPGATLTGTACLKRCVARALTIDLKKQIDIFDPTSTDASGTWSTNSVPRTGIRIDPASSFEIGPYATSLASAEGMIAVAVLP